MFKYSLLLLLISLGSTLVSQDFQLSGNIILTNQSNRTISVQDQQGFNPVSNHGKDLTIKSGDSYRFGNFDYDGGNLFLEAGDGYEAFISAEPGNLYLRPGRTNGGITGSVFVQSKTNNSSIFTTEMEISSNGVDIKNALEISGNLGVSGTGGAQMYRQLFIHNPSDDKYGWAIGNQTEVPGPSDNDLYFYVRRNNFWSFAAFIQDNTSGQMNFTGQHRALVIDIDFSDPNLIKEEYKGLIVVADQNQYLSMSGGLTTGVQAIQMNEALPVVSLARKVMDKSAFGVISSIEETREDAYGAFVTPFEKEEGDHRVYINSVGEGGIWVIDINGQLESGDYITSSEIPGYGMRQSSPYIANYTVAKITMDCDFNPETVPVLDIRKEKREIEEQQLEVNVLDDYGRITWEQKCDQDGKPLFEKAYKIRYLLKDGSRISETEYNKRKSNGEAVYKAAFVGCTYHCG